eukprot:CAMPEP_0201692266 /NCGR_PEP_ID=MMETSP0578-20130828/5215_1 /ASSEMBLY_ACC=CAM_ASM_000663 /TAXON_ID=267565 /ORGANISM="Skeletonema grethea, Strain CCMP 1804" /LENGTH=102 /DNA_ID=CAMNT_0048177621 /DNA_START=27 /DNA_END=335 /DNA_ORIENTATION=+
MSPSIARTPRLLRAADGLPLPLTLMPFFSQVDETNIAMLRHIYDGDDPAPFADQFTALPMREVHWTKTGNATLRHPEGGSVDGESESIDDGLCMRESEECIY